MNPATELLDRIQNRALFIGGVGLVACLTGAMLDREQFFRSYLMSWLFWTGLSSGCLALLMLHHLVGGSWGFVIRRLLEAGTRTLPLVTILAVPLWLNIAVLYVWAKPELAKGLEHKTFWYLKTSSFVERTFLYLLVWMALAYFYNKWSAEQDATGDPALAGRLESLAGPGLIFFGLTITFHAMDWGMSLEPHWYSTVYGLHFMIGQILAAMAFCIVMARLLSPHEPLSKVMTPSHFHDLGNLLLAFVMLWAYLTLSQFLITWSGNLPEEASWYVHRIGPGWKTVALFLVLFHWAAPLLILLNRSVKRRAERLARLAILLLFMRMVDIFWLIKPAFVTDLRIDWLDIALAVGLGGIWVGYFCYELKRRPLLAMRDPMAEELTAHPEHA